MSSITIHNMENLLEERLRSLAKEKNQSLNQTIKNLLEEALGIKQTASYQEDFSEFSGLWAAEDEAQYLADTQEFEQIEEKEWQ